jgi:hypothetical protein
MWQVPRCHPVQDYHTVIPFQHKRSTKQAKHENKNKQKATKIQKFRHLVISISVDEFLPIKAHLNKRGRLIHHYNKYDA